MNDEPTTQDVEALADSIATCFSNVSNLPEWMQVPALGRDMRPLTLIAARAVLRSNWYAGRPEVRRCWRIDAHDAHEWKARPDEDEGGPRQTVTCTGHVVTEGGWTRCPGCGTSGRPHPVGGVECRETAREKAISQGDE